MIEKCANPECSEPFYYGLGRLYFSPKSLDDKSPPANSHGVEHYWLCESCSKSFTFGLPQQLSRRHKCESLPRPPCP